MASTVTIQQNLKPRLEGCLEGCLEECTPIEKSNNYGQLDVALATRDLLKKAIAKVPIISRHPFVLCDYGTSDGATSLPIVSMCIDEVRGRHGSQMEVLVCYEDRPVNDFNPIFQRNAGLVGETSGQNGKPSGVYQACIGKSFFERCFPADTVHLAISFTAMHWLSKRPCPLKDMIHHTLSTDPKEMELFAHQAAVDWETILLARAHDLAPGGQMVIANLCKDEEGQCVGKSNHIKCSFFECLNSHWTDMYTEGKITQEEYHLFSFDEYYRTVDEYKKPFVNKNSAVYGAGLRLVSIETKSTPCQYHRSWQKQGHQGDSPAAWAHAKAYIEAGRTWCNWVILKLLNPGQSVEEKQWLVDHLFDRFVAQVAKSPAEHAKYLYHAYIHIEKVVPDTRNGISH